MICAPGPNESVLCLRSARVGAGVSRAYGQCWTAATFRQTFRDVSEAG